MYKRDFENCDFEGFNNEELLSILEKRKEKIRKLNEKEGFVLIDSVEGSNLYDSILIIVDILEDRGVEVDDSI